MSADGICTITLNRPEKRNAISEVMSHQLHDAWCHLRDSDDRVAVIRAEGPVFTAGVDMKDPPAHFWKAVPNVAFEIGKPVIAAVNGPAIAAGVSLVAFCDLCVASHSSSFVYPEARLGNAAGLISSVIPRIPHKVAMELMLLGKPISAQRAYEVGFINQLCEPGEESALADEMARTLAQAAPLVLKFLKQTARDTMPMGPVEAVYANQYASEAIASSEDAGEGARAFREKRAPAFKGR